MRRDRNSWCAASLAEGGGGVKIESIAGRARLFQIHQTFAICLPVCITLLTIPNGLRILSPQRRRPIAWGRENPLAVR